MVLIDQSRRAESALKWVRMSQKEIRISLVRISHGPNKLYLIRVAVTQSCDLSIIYIIWHLVWIHSASIWHFTEPT